MKSHFQETLSQNARLAQPSSKEELASSTEEEKANPEDYGEIRVLIVDDMPTNRKVLQHLIKKLGAQPETCASGEEALQLNSKNLYHLILLDLHMPTMSGFEVGEKIISKRSGQLPLVVAQTADETPQACDRTNGIGFDGHLTKPIRPPKVSDILQTIKGKHLSR
ncbi:response regulator [Puniceicoccus vermicola]|uniref:Response regulator n=1 Tax=Puniceicoccus vermicola TaxID=388746 RepID=A0A7X1B281_9BACT|nr:response regulator [Puniceicoccus vermicola]MBC2604212.1 response regulator [Puniceicoccus vermicola]